MARHVWSLICSKAIIDGATQNLSIFDVMEQVTVEIKVPEDTPLPENPAVPIALTIVSLWERSNLDVPEEKETFRVRLDDPNGKELARNDQVYSMVGPHVRARAIVNVHLQLHIPGRYEFHVMGRQNRQWRNVAVIPFSLTINVTRAEKPPRLS